MTIGFTNGCFDLLHPGHLHLLSFCRLNCDRLFVGLNTDWSIRQLKGEGRPIETWNEREANLKETGLVDMVWPFETSDQLRGLISLVKADTLFKGMEYTGKVVVGMDLVQTMIFVPMLPGHSTTAKIKGRLH